MIRRYAGREDAYADYARNFDAFFLTHRQNPTTAMMWKEKPDDGSDTSIKTGGASTVYEAIGYDRMFRRHQTLPGAPFSDASWATGCGPTAFLNLYTWHDENWTPDLLKGDGIGFDSIGTYTEQGQAVMNQLLRNYLGTFQSLFAPSDGATWPWNMSRGYDFAQNSLAATADRVGSWSIPFDSDATKLAQNVIRYYGKPVIIGYWSDVHYDLAYKWWTPSDAFPGYFLVDVDAIDTTTGKLKTISKWIEGDDLFYASAAFDFYSSWNMLTNPGFEAGKQGWGLIGQGNFVLRSPTPASHRGTAHLELGSPSGGTHSLKRMIPLNAPVVTSYTLSSWFAADTDAKVHMMVQDNNGKILGEKTFTASGGDWFQQSLSLPGVTLNLPAVLTVDVSAPAGKPLLVRIDDMFLTAQTPQQDPAHLPCVYAKPGLDSGCTE